MSEGGLQSPLWCQSIETEVMYQVLGRGSFELSLKFLSFNAFCLCLFIFSRMSDHDSSLEVQLPKELVDLTTIIDLRPECLATGDAAMQSAALTATKFIFDLGTLPTLNLHSFK